jgi:hypothetical protein
MKTEDTALFAAALDLLSIVPPDSSSSSSSNREQQQQRNNRGVLPVLLVDGVCSSTTTSTGSTSTKFCSVRMLSLLLPAVLALTIVPRQLLGVVPLRPMGSPAARAPVAMGDNVEVIGVDDNSTLGRDVTAIRHWRDAATVVVHFHPNSSCHNPVLRGRLSGPSLVSIEWSRTVSNNRTTELTGRYHIPTSGLHYIEIIALLCEEWTYDTDFKDICLEDPRHHRLTALNASITALRRSGSGSQEPSDTVGQWHWNSGEGGESSSSSASIVPLYTRWQRKTCGPNGTDYCPEEGSLDRFRPYTFTWRDDNSSVTPANLHAAYTRTATRLCYVGSSHAKQLLVSSQRLVPTENVTYFYAQYPHQVTAQFVQSMLDKFDCNRIVVGIGQWYVFLSCHIDRSLLFSPRIVLM